jgi:hypothetical protein
VKDLNAAKKPRRGAASPTPYYWLDPSWKVAGVLMSQILPFADPAVLGLSDQFERGVYKIAV